MLSVSKGFSKIDIYQLKITNIRTLKNAILHLGSNQGNRLAYLSEACRLIQNRIGNITAKSHVYETEPWGLKEQHYFLNIALRVQSTLSVGKLFETCKKIEMEIGREKKQHLGPRNIDIDLIFYENIIVNEPELVVPHKEMSNRNFVLIPVLEIAGDWVHPILKKTVDELYDECDDDGEVVLFGEIDSD